MTPPPTPRAAPPRWLRYVWDVVLFVFSLFVTVLGLANVPGAETATGMTDLGLGVWLIALVAWGTVFLRRRFPWVTLIAGLAVALLGVDYLLFLLGAFHVLVRADARRRVLIGCGTFAVVALWVVRDLTTPWGADVFTLDDGSGVSPTMATVAIAATSLVITAGSVALSVSLRTTAEERRRAEVEHTRATTLGDELARQAERQDLAREIHDGLTNRLALLSMMGGNVTKAVERGDPSAADLARSLQAQSREALGDLRGLVHDLREGPSAQQAPRGTMRAVPALIADARAAGTSVSATVVLDGISTANAALDSAVHRMAQESLTNAMKHAHGAPVSFYLEAAPSSGVRLRVTNPLAVRAKAHDLGGGGMGLVGIGERAAALGGTAWTGAHGGEFIVDVTLPWVVAGDESAASATTVTP